ncbi:MAG: SH3 domain-containing protein [Patescibacteria group bacterium]
MKKLYLGLLIIFILSATPALAASKSTASAKATWKPLAPDGYTPITWAKAPGIASFFKTPDGGGAIDFVTRIYLPQNQINFIISTGTPIDSSPIATTSDQAVSSTDTSSTTTVTDINNFPNLSFQRLGAELAKTVAPSIKFLWDAQFFNMQPTFTDLSLAVKYTVGTSTTISRGTRSIPDMNEARRMLLINNQTGTATIGDFDSAVFVDSKIGDQALEGFNPAVAKADSASGAASRLFLGVSDDGKELIVYCSQLATVAEASAELANAGASPEHQLEADGGGSAACGYNLPGQFFVEPTRTLPLLMGAETILKRGTVAGKTMNVRSGPATKNPIVAQLSKGAIVKVFEEKSGWYRIGIGQWVLKSLIK